MGCISPSENNSAIPPYDNSQNITIVIEDIRNNNLCSNLEDSENELSASEPETPRTGRRTGRLTIGPIISDPRSSTHSPIDDPNQIQNNINHTIPRKLSLSISKILNAAKKYTSKSTTSGDHDLQPSISFEKQPKYRCNGIYQSSSESEIKEASTNTNSKPSKSKNNQYIISQKKKYHNYNCSTSQSSHITDIKDEDSSSYDHNDFESITKLTNIGIHSVDTIDNETIDNGTNNDTTLTNIGSVTDTMSQISLQPKISPRLSLKKLKQLSPNIIIEPKYNPINKHYSAKWNVENPFYHSDDGEYDGDDTCDESYLSELSTAKSTKSSQNYHFYQSLKPKSNKSNKSIMEIKPHRLGDKIKMKSNKSQTKGKSKTYTNIYNTPNDNINGANIPFQRIKHIQLPIKSPKRYNNNNNNNNRKKSYVSLSHGTYNSLQAHQSASVADRDSVRDSINIGIITRDDESSNESSSNEFEDVAPVHLPYNSIRLSSNDTNTNTTNTTDGQPPPLPIKFIQTDSNKDSPFYQYTHYNYYYFDQNEKQKCHQIPLQRPCPPPHSFNAYSNKDSTTQTHSREINNVGWQSDNSTHV